MFSLCFIGCDPFIRCFLYLTCGFHLRVHFLTSDVFRFFQVPISRVCDSSRRVSSSLLPQSIGVLSYGHGNSFSPRLAEVATGDVLSVLAG